MSKEKIKLAPQYLKSNNQYNEYGSFYGIDYLQTIINIEKYGQLEVFKQEKENFLNRFEEKYGKLIKRILEEDIIIGIYTEKTSSILGENYSKSKRFVCRFNDFCEMLPFDVNDISNRERLFGIFQGRNGMSLEYSTFYDKPLIIEYIALYENEEEFPIIVPSSVPNLFVDLLFEIKNAS